MTSLSDADRSRWSKMQRARRWAPVVFGILSTPYLIDAVQCIWVLRTYGPGVSDLPFGSFWHPMPAEPLRLYRGLDIILDKAKRDLTADGGRLILIGVAFLAYRNVFAFFERAWLRLAELESRASPSGETEPKVD